MSMIDNMDKSETEFMRYRKNPFRRRHTATILNMSQSYKLLSSSYLDLCLQHTQQEEVVKWSCGGLAGSVIAFCIFILPIHLHKYYVHSVVCGVAEEKS